MTAMVVRGIRGAITVERNEEYQILNATSALLNRIIESNGIHPEEICCVFITVTHDLNATFPARAIREMPGWELVPLMCSLEIPVSNSLELCIRLMVQVNTVKSQREIHHVYMNNATKLRPDLEQTL